MGLKRIGETQGQPPPKVIVHAYTIPKAQAGTVRTHEIQASATSQERITQHQSLQNYDCCQVQKQLIAKPVAQLQVLSLGHAHDEPDALLKDEDGQLKQTQTVLSKSQTETKVLTLGLNQASMALEIPQQLSGSDSSSQSMSNIPITSQQQHTNTQFKTKPQTTTTTLQQQHDPLAKDQHFPEISHPCFKTSQQAQAKLHAQCDTPTHTQHGISPHALKQAQAQPKARQRQRGQGKTPGTAHIPGQTEVYSRAQAMARSRMEKAKQHLHEHIEEVITIFNNRVISEEQARRKQVNPNTLQDINGTYLSPLFFQVYLAVKLQ